MPRCPCQQVVQDNAIKFVNVEKQGPEVRALSHACTLRNTNGYAPAGACAQELSVSLVDNALQQLKQLKGA
jgi:hypothetical protein